MKKCICKNVSGDNKNCELHKIQYFENCLKRAKNNQRIFNFWDYIKMAFKSLTL